MVNRMKFLVILVLGTIGLSGCILVDDDIPSYSHYPYGSYEAAVDYYHRPPRAHISHHKHQNRAKPEPHHLNKSHPVKKPEPPKREKIHHPKKDSHHEPKKEIRKPEQSKKTVEDKLHHPKQIEQPGKSIEDGKHHSKQPEKPALQHGSVSQPLHKPYKVRHR